MRVVIAGCGRVGSDLAMALADEGHDVSVIDEVEASFKALGSTFNGTTHPGVAYNVVVLRAAGIEFADAFVAVTNSDNANAMAVQVARAVFGISLVIARLDDPGRAGAYRAMNVRFVAGARLTARVVKEQLVESEFDYHVTFADGDIEIVEMVLGGRADGLAVSDFEIPGGLRVAAVRRGTRIVIPKPDFPLQRGDLVVASAKRGVRQRVTGYLVDVEPELA